MAGRYSSARDSRVSGSQNRQQLFRSGSYPLQVVARLRDYENCHDGDVDEAASLIVRMNELLENVFAQCGNECGSSRGNSLTPSLVNSIRDLLRR